MLDWMILYHRGEEEEEEEEEEDWSTIILSPSRMLSLCLA
jgi:hypothetical protein